MTVAILGLQTSSLDDEPIAVTFDVFPTVDGYPSNQSMHEEEELTSPGINGKRWRTIFDQIPQIVVDPSAPAITVATTYAAACTQANTIRRCKGRFGIITITSGSSLVTVFNVHVTAVSARVIPGPVVGAGLSGNAASVASSWVLDVLA